MSLLTIVIPCYNRHELITSCIRSIGDSGWDGVYVLVVDDGSTPPLDQGEIGIPEGRGEVMRLDKNSGRAKALRTGLLGVQSEFVMIMDSDDEFEPGAVHFILEELRRLGDDHVGVVFPCSEFESGRAISTLPNGISASLLALRADYRVKGDIKEVVRSEVVKANLYPDPFPERRVPTSFIWAGVSNSGPVRTVARVVVRHRYLAEGMTRSIWRLKRQNPYWLSRTYHRVAVANEAAYRSKSFRLVSAAKALAVRKGGLESELVEDLKVALGTGRFHVARFLGVMIWLLTLAKTWGSGQAR